MDAIALFNKVRSDMATTYSERIPEANVNNITTIQSIMSDGGNINVVNDFMSTLLNKLTKTVLITKIFENPLKALKKGHKPLGDGVEEIYNNFIKGEKFDQTGANLLSRNLPDTKTVYHRKNYEMQYPITINRDVLVKAFSSWEAFEAYCESVIATLHNSAELDEFSNMKQLLAIAIKNKAVKTINVVDPCESEANAKKFIKEVKTTSRLMTFPNSNFNAYLDAQTTDTKPIITFSRKNEQILFLDAEVDTTVSIDVLASTFNMTVAEFNDTRKVVIDMFPEIEGGIIRGMLVDEQFFQIFDDFIAITNFYNAKGLYTNYYLTIIQTIAYSILVNAVAFVVDTTASTTE